MSALLTAERLSVAAGGRTLCRDLNLELAPGQRWAILGPNGAGKSSLLHTLAGVRPPAAGRVLLGGREINRTPRPAVARRLGLLLQQEHDPFPATVLETVVAGRHPHLGLWRQEGETEREAARAALAAMDLEGFEGRRLATLSGGERRRVGIATLLCQDPEILLLDEPAEHLDLRHGRRLFKLLDERARAGRTVVMVLHDPTIASWHADQVLLLAGDGRAQSGAVRQVLTADNLSRLYGHPLLAVAHPAGALFVPGW